jgi:hypothetical protein
MIRHTVDVTTTPELWMRVHAEIAQYRWAHGIYALRDAIAVAVTALLVGGVLALGSLGAGVQGLDAWSGGVLALVAIACGWTSKDVVRTYRQRRQAILQAAMVVEEEDLREHDYHLEFDDESITLGDLRMVETIPWRDFDSYSIYPMVIYLHLHGRTWAFFSRAEIGDVPFDLLATTVTSRIANGVDERWEHQPIT